ncbi:MAG: 50S ribosomal protein L5 [Patescibacteria group bacterium]|nr:50S ribosomal protein L5 [Patescibacteria group bacterium]
MKTFKEEYQEIRKALKEELSKSSTEAVPKIVKITLNVGAGQAVNDSNYIESVRTELAKITGQNPVVTKARKSIAGFKVREGMPIGIMVTLRGQKMYDFLNKLINVALPRVRDFQGLSPKSLDGKGNYTVGIKEHIVFPEVNLDNIEKTFGLAVTLHTTAENNDDAKALLGKLNFPFKK